jgi:hypothetical protein
VAVGAVEEVAVVAVAAAGAAAVVAVGAGAVVGVAASPQALNMRVRAANRARRVPDFG